MTAILYKLKYEVAELSVEVCLDCGIVPIYACGFYYNDIKPSTVYSDLLALAFYFCMIRSLTSCDLPILHSLHKTFHEANLPAQGITPEIDTAFFPEMPQCG